MSYKEFSEKTRVQIPAMVHLLRLGYKYLGNNYLSKDKTYDYETNILLEIFESQYKKLNLNCKQKDIEDTLINIKNKLRNDDLGKSFYEECLLSTSKKIIDFDNIENNTFHFTAEFSCLKGKGSFRPDITLFINGLPLVMIELKKPNNKDTLVDEQKRMLKDRIPNKKFRRFLNLTQLMIFSNNMDYSYDDGIKPTQGAFYSTISDNKVFFNCFREDYVNGEELGFYEQFKYKEIDSNEELKILSDFDQIDLQKELEYQTNIDKLTWTNRIITSLCSKKRLLDILKYGIAFLKRDKEENGVFKTTKEKHIIRYPQLFALYALKNKLDQNIKSGTIWHVQGSGKTALSYFLTKFITDYYAKQNVITKFYFIVDRLDLLQQASSEFEARGLKVNKIKNKSEETGTKLLD
ncbi:type I restriction endonuclease [Mycoplasma cottewii]|uniref:type I site-specific deoxyribonuclease n=1 Tax=Mycoplasma cottewii TaxID=51364 RepID=A0ABY5U1P7_9MOLU|nr:type I restriction endonuclease [Mycoplasma cottewii]UWD35214.1 type I restriction endonuclease [Mycoplasma cottewii]